MKTKPQPTQIPDAAYDAALSAITDGELGDHICDNVGEISKTQAKAMYKSRVLQHVTSNPACKDLSEAQIKELAKNVLDDIVESYWS